MGGDVDRLSLAEDVPGDDGGTSVEVVAVGRDGLRTFQMDHVANGLQRRTARRAKVVAVREHGLVGFVFVEVVRLLRPDAKHFAQCTGVASTEAKAGLVHDAREPCRDEGPARLDELLDSFRETVAQHEERRGDDDLVAIKLRVAVEDVDVYAAPPVRQIVREAVGGRVALHGADGAVRDLEVPARLPVRDDADLGLCGRPQHRAQRLKVVADLRHFLEHARTLATLVVDDRAVELLGASPALADLEVLHGVGAVRDGLERLHPVHSGTQQTVVMVPVHGAWRGLHQKEWLPEKRAVEVVDHGIARRRALRLAGAVVVLRVAVPRHDVQLLRHAPVV